MKLSLVIISFLFFVSNINSQHTARFLELSENLKFIDSSETVKRYKNGNLKEVQTTCTYEFGEYKYTYRCFKNQFYRKNGQLSIDEKLDGFGNILTYKFINENKKVFVFLETVSIDNTSKNTIDFIRKKRNFKIKVLERSHITCKNDSLILIEEGYRLNRKKIDVWKTYNCCDSSFKAKNHSK